MDLPSAITDAGRRLLASGEADTVLTPTQRLALEISARTNNITGYHLVELCMQLDAHYGSAEAALAALRSGDCVLERVAGEDA